jgi:hypothetical protein
MLHISIRFSSFLLESSREIVMGSEGVFMGSIMEDKISEHSTNFCRVFFFAGKMPASNIRYNILWVQEDERSTRMVNPAEKNYGRSRD